MSAGRKGDTIISQCDGRLHAEMSALRHTEPSAAAPVRDRHPNV
jgi:hypothetical protein